MKSDLVNYVVFNNKQIYEPINVINMENLLRTVNSNMFFSESDLKFLDYRSVFSILLFV